MSFYRTYTGDQLQHEFCNSLMLTRDHIGDHEPFCNAKFILGAPAKRFLQDGYPYNATSLYSRSTVPDDRTMWLDCNGWTPIGPFERALDFFDDGSLYIVDAAGHMPGHINALVRTSSDGKWAFLAGDSFHDERLLTGEKQIGHYVGSDGNLVCMHQDEVKAKDHISRIISLPKSVRIWFAHDPLWKEKLKTSE
jgi:glyoxylase-like metal-dependent hydrolase (beta-lactamase superfamily II)